MVTSSGQSVSPVTDYFAGAIAGGANIFSGYPFDTVKVRLQTQTCHYPNAWSCFRSILRHEGPSGLFRGLTSPLIGGALETGINYGVYAYTMSMLHMVPDMAATPLAAGTAGVFMSLVVSPAELVKCRMQLGATDTAHHYRGSLDCLKQVIKEEGPLRGLTRGIGHTMVREIPGNAIFFSSYMGLRSFFPGKHSVDGDPKSLGDQLAGAASAITAGGLAGMIMWACILPLDAAKTNKQTATPGSLHDVGVFQNLKLLYARGGVKTLYSGLSPTMARAFPANAVQWLTWELCMQHLPKFTESFSCAN